MSATTAAKKTTARKSATPKPAPAVEEAVVEDAPNPALRQVEVAGRTWLVDTSIFADYDLVESIAAFMMGNPFAMPQVLRSMLGEQYAEVVPHLADEKGHTSTEAVAQFTRGLIQADSPNS